MVSCDVILINKYDHMIVQATSFAAIPSVCIVKTLASCTKRLPKISGEFASILLFYFALERVKNNSGSRRLSRNNG